MPLSADVWPAVVMLNAVFCVTNTASLPGGVTPITWKVSLPPKYGTMTLSPLIRGTLSSASARYLSSIGGIASSGATITFSAGIAFIFLTTTVSPIATPELFRTRPSTRIIPLPSSEGYSGRHFATVRRLPLISTTSPVEAVRESIES